MKRSTIAIIGAGRVGTTAAYAIMLNNIAAEILLVDLDEQRCSGEILDLSDALSFCDTSSIKSATPEQAAQADIIVITAGAAQKQGQTRLSLLQANTKIITSILESLKPINPNTVIIMVTNPVDMMTAVAQQQSGLPKQQVFGSGTFLDTQRLCHLLAQKLEIAEQSIDAFILGEHGDTQFPAWTSAHVAGKPLLKHTDINQKDLDDIAQQTKNKAYEIISRKGYTSWGIAACVSEICESILFDQKRVMPLSFYQEEFDVCLSLPAVLGAHGIEKAAPISLSNEEKQQLAHSAETLKKIGQEV